jgi:hypothetical protein
LLTAACALASLAFAFAAFAVLAAAMLPLQPALIIVGAPWLVNQAIGFGLQDYPADIHTIMWGLVIGAAALVATAPSALVVRTLPRTRDPAAFALALIAAYAAYELVLFAVTPFLGGAGAFTAAIVGRLGFLSALWLIGLIAVCEALRLFNSMRWRQLVGAADEHERHGESKRLGPPSRVMSPPTLAERRPGSAPVGSWR